MTTDSGAQEPPPLGKINPILRDAYAATTRMLATLHSERRSLQAKIALREAMARSLKWLIEDDDRHVKNQET